MPEGHDATGPVRKSSPEVLNQEVPGVSLRGVTAGWFGPLDTFVANLGISRDVEKRLRKSLDGDDGFIAINQQQVFVTAEAGWRHLRLIANGGDDGVAVPRPAPKGKAR